MRRITSAVKTSARWLLRAVVVLLLLVTALIWRPEWVLTPKVLTSLTRKFAASYHPRWTSFEPRIRSRGFLTKEALVKASDFCVHDDSATVAGCFQKLDVAVVAVLSTRGVELSRVARFDAAATGLALDLSAPRPAAKTPEKKKRKRDGLLPSSLTHLRVDEMDVRLDDSTLKLASATVTGDLALSYSSGLVVSSRLYYDTPEKGENIDARLLLQSDLFTEGRLTFLRLKGRVSGDVEDSATIDARIDQKEDGALALKGSAKVINGARRLAARIAGDWTKSRYKGELFATLDDSSSTLRSVTADRCGLEAPIGKGDRIDGVSLKCRVTLEPRPFGAPPGSEAKKLDVAIAFDGRRKPSLTQKDGFEASLKVAVVPRKDWYEFRGGLEAKLAGRLGDLPRSLKSQHDIDLTVKVAKFQDLVKYLKGTAFAIPAPLHVLEGPLEAFFKSRGDSRKDDQKFTYGLKSDLASGKQKLLAKVDGEILAKKLFAPQRAFKDDTSVTLEDLRLELPYLKIGSIPGVSVDPRIMTGTEKEQADDKKTEAKAQARKNGAPAGSSFDYAARLRTGKPLTLYTNINPAPIPIGIELTATPAGLKGSITVETFKAELFKKKGTVDHVTLTTIANSSALDLDGLVQFHESDADIQVKLLGSTEKPKVIFESDPPMDQQAIIALLLFGKAPDDLDPDQSASVSNSQSAMANGAFGLASLYLFASTPVQYVGYDPATQTYAIKFSLPGGASLEVGSGANEAGHLTVRKRLARHWVIETELQREDAQQSQPRNAVTTFLQWFNRY